MNNFLFYILVITILKKFKTSLALDAKFKTDSFKILHSWIMIICTHLIITADLFK